MQIYFVLGSVPALLGMPDNELVDILNIIQETEHKTNSIIIKPSLKQCTGWSMHEICKAVGHPSPTTLLFSRPIEGLMLRFNRVPINYSCGEDHRNALKICQNESIKNNDILKESINISTGSLVTVKCEDHGSCTYSALLQNGDANHNGQQYIIWGTTW